MDESFSTSLRAFQRAFVNKLAESGPLHPEMVNTVLQFFGEAPSERDYPAGTPEYASIQK